MRGTKKISLGWLLPYSGIFSHLKMDLQQGLETALNTDGDPITVRSIPEFIQTGSLQDTEKALQKLIQYEQVDLIIGVLSSKVAVNIIPMLEKHRTALILLNLGADIPIPGLSSDLLLYNSLHCWKSEWAMGYWAQQKFGGEPSLNLSAYEGGYGMHEAFKTGAGAAGATTMKLNLVKNFSSTPDTSPLIQYLSDQQPGHAHALLSGSEGEQFLQLFREKGLADKIELTVNPFMAEDGILSSIPGNMNLYNAATWSYTVNNPSNLAFVSQYQERYDEHPTVFSLLAYEAGLALRAARHKDPGRNELPLALAQTTASGPRGEIALSTRSLRTPQPVYIRKPMPSPIGGRPENIIVESLHGIEWNDPSLPVENLFYTGWQNPYLCV